MIRGRASIICAAALVALMSGCVSPQYRAAVAKFGTETDALMSAQSKQIETISDLETTRLREKIVSGKVRLGLNEDCFEERDANGEYPECQLINAETGQAVVYHYELRDVVDLQDALARYGNNLAELSGAAEDDKDAFAAAVSDLGASIGKLDATIAKVAKTERVGSDEKIGTIASIIGSLGKLAFAYQRQHALKRIIIATDPLVTEAMDMLAQSDAEATDYKRLGAINHASDARAKSNTAFASGNVDEIGRSNEALYDAVGLLNQIHSNTEKLKRLAAIHSALAVLARSNDVSARTALAKKQLADWTADQPTGEK